MTTTIRALAFPTALSLACAATLAITGCSKTHERSSRNGRVDAGADSGLAFVDPASGQPVVFGSGDKLPDAFPKTVPLYPGAKIVGAVASAEGGQAMHTSVVTLFTTDTPAQVDDFYRTHVKGAQTLKENADATSRTRVLDDPANKTTLTMTATKSGDGTTVQLTAVVAS